MFSVRRVKASLVCAVCRYSVVTLNYDITDTLSVPAGVPLPSYHKNGIPPPRPLSIDLKSTDSISKLRDAGHLAGEVLDKTLENATVGITTDELDKFAHSEIVKRRAYPAPLNYRGFPKSICTSVNNVLCHGIPCLRALESGDIISIDVSVYYNGVYGDCCSTAVIGTADRDTTTLLQVTRDSTLASVAKCVPGVSFSVIGKTISGHAHAAGLSICKEFVGHGIGHYFHGLPEVYHYENRGGPIMLPGMVFTIEPILMEGRDGMSVLGDGWTAVTVDDKRAAQFEHTVAITQDGHEILSPHR